MSSSDTGPYSDAEFDAEFLRTQRSDRLYVVYRLATLTLVFWFMARGIVAHGLTASFLLLPLAVEFVSVMWVGQILSRFIDCDAFQKTAKPGLVVFWTLAFAGIISVVVAIEDGAFAFARIVPGWKAGWRTVVESGLVWALVVEVVSLVTATVPEVMRWRRVGGTFVWTAVLGIGVRFAALLLLGIVAVAALFFMADLGGGWLFDRPQRVAWFTWGFLLCVELGALILGVKIHADLKRKAPGSTPAREERTRSA